MIKTPTSTLSCSSSRLDLPRSLPSSSVSCEPGDSDEAVGHQLRSPPSLRPHLAPRECCMIKRKKKKRMKAGSRFSRGKSIIRSKKISCSSVFNCPLWLRSRDQTIWRARPRNCSRGGQADERDRPGLPLSRLRLRIEEEERRAKRGRDRGTVEAAAARPRSTAASQHRSSSVQSFGGPVTPPPRPSCHHAIYARCHVMLCDFLTGKGLLAVFSLLARRKVRIIADEE